MKNINYASAIILLPLRDAPPAMMISIDAYAFVYACLRFCRFCYFLLVAATMLPLLPLRHAALLCDDAAAYATLRCCHAATLL